MPKLITEAGKITAADTATGKVMITLITPGWGSSGYYSAEVLKQAAEDKVFPVRTQQHIDHMTEAERRERPAGSLLTLAAGLTENAVWEPAYVDEETGNKGRLAAPSLVGSRYRDIITEFKDFIGTSIAVGADVTIGEAEGRKGTIIEKLYPDPMNRVDFVTVAGRGGKVDKILEAAARRIEEATANDVRAAISAAVSDAYQNDGVWVWVLDYDDTNVWFSQESAGESKTWQQAYTMNDLTAELTGDLIEVRRVTSYTPVTPTQESTDSVPNPATVTENQEEATMATIDDKELADLRESASRATTAEAANTTAIERATRAEEALTAANDTAAAAVVEAAFSAAGITAPKTAARLSKGYPVAESGVLDTDALTADVAESIAELQVANGAGTVRGVGHAPVTESADVADADVLTALKGA